MTPRETYLGMPQCSATLRIGVNDASRFCLRTSVLATMGQSSKLKLYERCAKQALSRSILITRATSATWAFNTSTSPGVSSTGKAQTKWICRWVFWRSIKWRTSLMARLRACTLLSSAVTSQIPLLWGMCAEAITASCSQSGARMASSRWAGRRIRVGPSSRSSSVSPQLHQLSKRCQTWSTPRRCCFVPLVK